MAATRRTAESRIIPAVFLPCAALLTVAVTAQQRGGMNKEAPAKRNAAEEELQSIAIVERKVSRRDHRHRDPAGA